MRSVFPVCPGPAAWWRRARVGLVLFVAVLGCLTGPVRAQSAGFVVESPATLETKADQVRRLDRAPLARSLQQAGLAMPPAVRVFLVDESAPLARATPPWFVGRAFDTDRVVVFPTRIAAYPYDSLESVVRHEVVHLALTIRAGGHPLPRWFHEGVATSVEAGWNVTGQLRLLLAAFDRPRVDDVNRLFAADARPASEQAYLLAAALVEDLRERHGDGVVGAIAGRVAGGLPFERAFEAETGETVDEAAATAWAGYRRLAMWLPIVTSPTAVWIGILALAVVAFVFERRRRRERRRRWDEEERLEEAPPG